MVNLVFSFQCHRQQSYYYYFYRLRLVCCYPSLCNVVLPLSIGATPSSRGQFRHRWRWL